MNKITNQIELYNKLEKEKEYHKIRSFVYSTLGASAIYLGSSSDFFVPYVTGAILVTMGIAHAGSAIDARCFQNELISVEVDDIISFVHDNQ